MAVSSLFVPGTLAQVEYPARADIYRKGWGTHVEQGGGINWVHLAVPSAGLIGGVDQFVTTVFVLYRTVGAALITDVHVQDGGALVQAFGELRLSGDRLTDSDLNSASNAWRLDPPSLVRHGLGLSVAIDFRSGGGVLFGSAGAYFEPTI